MTDKPIQGNQARSRCPVCRAVAMVTYTAKPSGVGVEFTAQNSPICSPCLPLLNHITDKIMRDFGREGVYSGETLYREFGEGVQ